ncbi:MAG: hypothetical protein ACU0CO_13800, partial [Shimia sp.]
MDGIEHGRGGFRGTFIISWQQTATDGHWAAPVAMLAQGSGWRWTGEAVRIDGPHDVMRLEGAVGAAEMRARAALVVRKMVGAATGRNAPPTEDEIDLAEPLRDSTFVVTDGRGAA